ncbi:hypothetical protein SASPL_121058 [Salvia splendens]|uniref:CCR4-NOT transcription complex subunit 2 n=1 Tax=Salvia splendens TaxID=180675 RepID=A0A8X8XU68_SALSN|nr:hypothetical protein SASPL_121058 [Salvia splendens]
MAQGFLSNIGQLRSSIHHGPEAVSAVPAVPISFISPFRDKDIKATPGSQSIPDQYGMLGLISIVKKVNPTLATLALGLDLTTLGLNLNSSETLHKKFSSPWSDEPVRGETGSSVYLSAIMPNRHLL